MSIFRIFLLLWLVDSLHLREDAVSQLMKNCEPIVYVSALLSVYPYLWSMQRCRWALIYLSIHGARLGPNPKQSVIWAMSIRRDPVFENGSNAAGIAIPESKCTYSGCHCLYEHGNNDLRRMRISASPSNFLCGGTCDLYDHVSSTSRCHYLVTEQARLICCARSHLWWTSRTLRYFG